MQEAINVTHFFSNFIKYFLFFKVNLVRPCDAYIDGLMQERLIFIANALELRLPCIKPTVCLSGLRCHDSNYGLFSIWIKAIAWNDTPINGQVQPLEQPQWNSIEYEKFLSRKYIWTSCLQKGIHFVHPLLCEKNSYFLIMKEIYVKYFFAKLSWQIISQDPADSTGSGDGLEWNGG